MATPVVPSQFGFGKNRIEVGPSDPGGQHQGGMTLAPTFYKIPFGERRQ